MAEITKSGTPSPCTPLIPALQRLSELVAGEAIAAGDACYIKSDGKIWRSTGAAANAAAKVDGFAAMAAGVGQPVTLITESNWYYGGVEAMNPGARVFLSGTNAGQLADAASTGGTAPVGYVIDATNTAGARVRLYASRY